MAQLSCACGQYYLHVRKNLYHRLGAVHELPVHVSRVDELAYMCNLQSRTAAVLGGT